MWLWEGDRRMRIYAVIDGDLFLLHPPFGEKGHICLWSPLFLNRRQTEAYCKKRHRALMEV